MITRPVGTHLQHAVQSPLGVITSVRGGYARAGMVKLVDTPGLGPGVSAL